METTRQLAAIMFTDMVGYTALMQKNEQAAIERRNRHREIFEKAMADHGGKILQYYGDGTLSIFTSAIHAELALRSDPLSLMKNNQLGETLLFAGRLDEAEKQLIKTLEIDPNWRTPIRNLGFVYMAAGNYQKSYEMFDQIRREVNQFGKGITGFIIALALLGKREEAYSWLEQLLRRAEEDSTVALHGVLCVCYAVLGDLDKAFYYLDSSYEKNMGIIFFGIRYPINTFLKKDERFWQLLERMGLRQYYEERNG